MNYKFSAFTFIYQDLKFDYNEPIMDFNEFLLVIKKLFNLSDLNQICFNYLENRNFKEEIRISTIDEFNYALTFHFDQRSEDRMTFIIRVRNDSSTPLPVSIDDFSINFSHLPLQESNLLGEFYNKKEIKKIDYNDKEILNLKKEIELMKLELIRKDEIIEYFKKNEIMNNNIINNFEFIKAKLDQLIINKNSNNFQIKKEINLELNLNLEDQINSELEKEENFNQLGDYNLLNTNNINNVCTNCKISQIIIKCTICTNYFLCSKCFQYCVKHENHPMITIIENNQNPHFTIENISMMNFNNNILEKSQRLDYNNNKKFFMDRMTRLILSITTYGESFLYLNSQRDEELIIPIEILNYSNCRIGERELLLTAKNNSIFKMENRIVEEKLKKEGKIETIIKIISPNKEGIYEFQIIILHLFRKIEFKPLQIKIEVKI